MNTKCRDMGDLPPGQRLWYFNLSQHTFVLSLLSSTYLSKIRSHRSHSRSHSGSGVTPSEAIEIAMVPVLLEDGYFGGGGIRAGAGGV